MTFSDLSGSWESFYDVVMIAISHTFPMSTLRRFAVDVPHRSESDGRIAAVRMTGQLIPHEAHAAHGRPLSNLSARII